MFNKDSANRMGDAYTYTGLCPIKNGTLPGRDLSYESAVRQAAEDLTTGTGSPFAKTPGTYMARLYVLKDVFYESKPAVQEHLKSQYLIVSCDFHGDPDTYLWDMWQNASHLLEPVLRHCVAFDDVLAGEQNPDLFVAYMRKCQIQTALPFNGSTDQPLGEQLKGLYLKQKFGEFVRANQALDDQQLHDAFKAFLAAVQIDDLVSPTWKAGADKLTEVEITDVPV